MTIVSDMEMESWARGGAGGFPNPGSSEPAGTLDDVRRAQVRMRRELIPLWQYLFGAASFALFSVLLRGDYVVGPPILACAAMGPLVVVSWISNRRRGISGDHWRVAAPDRGRVSWLAVLGVGAISSVWLWRFPWLDPPDRPITEPARFLVLFTGFIVPCLLFASVMAWNERRAVRPA